MTSALFRGLKIGNRLVKAQEYNLASWIDNDAKAFPDDSVHQLKSSYFASLKKLSDQPGQNGTVALDSDSVSYLTKNVLYGCQTSSGRMRNCLQKGQKIIRKHLMKGNFEPLGIPAMLSDFVRTVFSVTWKTLYFMAFQLPAMLPGYKLFPMFFQTVVFEGFFVKLVYNPLLKSTLGPLNEAYKRFQTELFQLVATLKNTSDKNWMWLLFRMPDKILATLRHDWTLTEVACYVPALSGPAASLGVGLLAAASVAQPESMVDFTRWINCALVFVMGVFFMSVIPAHAQRSVGGGYDNECIAVAPMCFAGFFFVKAVQHNVSGTTGFLDWTLRVVYAVLAGLSHGFMAAGWGGYVFLINLVASHAGALFILERLRIYRSTKDPSRRFNELWVAYSVFYIVGTSIAVQIPVIGWAPLTSLEQILGLAVFVLVNLAKLSDVFAASSLFAPLLSQLRQITNSTAASHTLRPFSSVANVLFTGRGITCFVALLGALTCYGVAMDVDNFPLMKLFEKFFMPLSGRVKSLFGFHAVRTGNPLIDSVSEHQASNESIYFRTLDRTMYMATAGMAFLCLDLVRMGLRWLLLVAGPSVRNFVFKRPNSSSSDDYLMGAHNVFENNLTTDMTTPDQQGSKDEDEGPRNRKKLGRTTSTKSSEEVAKVVRKAPSKKEATIADKLFVQFSKLVGAGGIIAKRYLEFCDNAAKQKRMTSSVFGFRVADLIFGGNSRLAVSEESEAKGLSSQKLTSPLTRLNALLVRVVCVGIPNCIGKEDPSTPVATAGLYCVIFGFSTYMFSLKMARLIIFLGPTSSALAAVACGRIAQWVLEPLRVLTYTPVGDDVEEVFDSDGDLPEDSAALSKNLENPQEAASETASPHESNNSGTTQTSGLAKKQSNNSTTSTYELHRNSSQRLFVLFLRAVTCFALVFRFNIFTHMSTFLNQSYQMIQYGMSHPQIVSQNQDGSLKDDYREAYWWIRDNTAEDARILAWWDYG